MTVVVLYLCFYCICSGESCACKSNSQAREPAAVICPSFIASARLSAISWMFSHVGLIFYTKGGTQISFFLMCFFECLVCLVTKSLMIQYNALWGLHAAAVSYLVNFCRNWECPFCLQIEWTVWSTPFTPFALKTCKFLHVQSIRKSMLYMNLSISSYCRCHLLLY